MNSPKIRIAVLDSNPKSRKYLVKLIGNEADLDVVAESPIINSAIKCGNFC